MEFYVRIFLLYLLCVSRASKVPTKETAELGDSSRNLSRISTEKIDGIDQKENSRDKRALGLLLSGLAQIFGYTVTPIQFASLPNSNVMGPTAMLNSSMASMNVTQKIASTRPTSTTTPRQQETIRFTGVLNFGNNSDIIGHLQRYEQIFHGRNNATTVMMTTMRPSTPPAKIDPRTNSQTKPPLLAPFFVKIPLPIAPELLPATLPVEDLGLSYPPSAVSFVSDMEENTEMPVRKEQETIYRNNEDTERYTVEEKDIYDEKDVKKPMDQHKHQLYIDEPNYKQQNNRQNELRCKERERIRKLEEQEKKRNRDKPARYNEEEMNERYRNREKEIANRNRNHASRHEEERKPTRGEEEDEDSAERLREYASQENLSNEYSKQSSREEKQDYPNYDDDSDRVNQPEDFDKYVEEGYNKQLPIGDYFHEGNPEVIRDSYGEILDNKKDDRIAGYINMFKHISSDSQRSEPENTSREENERETEDNYDEHLIKLQKLREEYALPENKYEEYDLNEEGEEERNDRQSDRIQSHRSKPRRPSASSKRPSGPAEPTRKDIARLENAEEEDDFPKYLPLIVPVRYIDANDKIQQATTRKLKYNEPNKLPNNRFDKNSNADPIRMSEKNLTPQIGLPERPRQLHEGEHKELHVWPPPFDFAFDNTAPANTVVSPNPQNYYPRNYAPNYYQHVKEIAAQDANDKTSEPPSGYLVVVSNPVHPYRYPYNIYYFPNEAISQRDQSAHLNTGVERPQDRVYVAQQSVGEQIVQRKPNVTGYNLNETNDPRDYYYQSQEIPASVLDRYQYVHEERIPQIKEPFNIEVKNQLANTENWSNRIYQSQLASDIITKQSPQPVFTRLQNIVPSNQNVHNKPLERLHHSRLLRRQRRSENHSENEKKIPQSTLKNKLFDDPQSAHDFFGFSKNDYNFGSESSNVTEEENGKIAEKSDALVVAEPIAYHHDDESMIKQADEPENDTEKAKIREYRNKVATLKVSERRQSTPNGPIQYVDFIRNF